MSAASMNEVEEFLNGALVSWLESCLPRPEILSGYPSLLDGTIIHTVWLQIDPEPQNQPIKLENLDEITLANARAKNFDSIVKNLKILFEEELDQTVLVLPDCSILGHSPESRGGLEQMKLLLTLLLGAAVQCPNKEIFIGRIKELNVVTQHAIVDIIKQVTDNQSLVLTNDSLDQLAPDQMYHHIIRIARERDRYHSNWITSLTANETESKVSSTSTASATNASVSSTSATTDSNHMVELADLKSKLRKFRQELEEKSETCIEIREELDHKSSQYEKLRLESQEWYTESRRAAAYRDEVDVLRERAERADRLEVEVQRFREKLSDSEFFKTRVEELREDNRMLLETKEMLEEQLQRSRKRSEHAMALESEIIKYKQKINDMQLERDVDKAKLQEVLEENTQLQLATKNHSNKSDFDSVHSDDECASGDNSLSEQLTNNAQTRALRLELENRRLQQSLDAIKESNFHESANKQLELEKDKKKLSLKNEQLQDNCLRLTQQNQELEAVFKNALEENRKLQDSMDNRQQANERQQQEREVDRMKLIDVEKHVETLTKEKQRIQNLSESIQRRADDLERVLDLKTKEIDVLQPKASEYESNKNEIFELQNKIGTLEKENGNLSKDVNKFKEILETKDVLLDKSCTELNTKTKEIQQLLQQVNETTIDHGKLKELETRNIELVSQGKILEETITTLRKDLITGTLATKKVQQDLEKLGLNNNCDEELGTIDLNVETVVEKLVKNPETFRTVREIMLNVSKEMTSSDMCVLCHKKEIFTVEKNIEITNDCDIDFVVKTEEVLSAVSAQWKDQCDQLMAKNTELQATSDALQAENARQKVDVSTLGSQITSLNTQHVALQLANSQLAAEKDAFVKKIDQVKQQHTSLQRDQVALQCLHEQLSSEYEALSKEKEMIKTNLRDARIDIRDLKERELTANDQIETLKKKIVAMQKEIERLINLRAEHSKLTDDFRNLFATHERLKSEYKSIQDQYKIIRSDNGRLKLKNTELSGELNTRTDQEKSLEIELSKCSHRCDMLMQMNASLDIDRRKLMEHVSQLLTQYHELLEHSLDDKQHYHNEEKLFNDKVNNLHRQKEKLEEKIMEHYKKLESCSPKKKVFGANFVKRVKKVSSDFISKVPSRNRRSWIDDSRLSQSQILGSESGGNDSDNSIEEPNSAMSDTHLLQRNAHFRQSLQRKPNNEHLMAMPRGGIRSSFQSLKREDSTKSQHRNSIHALEPPDVTGSSLTLGTAGSRKTVYLIDELTKLPDSQNISTTSTTSSTSTTSTAAAGVNTATADHQTAVSSSSSSTANTSNNTNNAENNQPATLLMYNRISNIYGDVVGGNDQQNNNAGGSNDSNLQDKNLKEKKKPSADDKSNETAVWYEYGCV